MTCCVVTNAPYLAKSDRRLRNPSWLKARIFMTAVSLSFEQRAGENTLQYRCSVPSNLEGENCGRNQVPPTSLPLPPTPRKELRIDGCLKYLHDAKALYFYKYPCILWDSNQVPTVPQCPIY
ncbi:hypothetical protein TNCV_3361121 [Trichonephila clavipes]|nr:hypothetical protein TNCV_3361111 [Trichonephila clavipes]GFV26459.1 hypothetical protein TNCV_3361121 [Trichonephila clavipes]